MKKKENIFLKKWLVYSIITFWSGVYVGCVYKTIRHDESIILKEDEIKTYFSPNGGAKEAIIEQIERAKDNIYIFVYAFNCPDILKALENAERRGVRIFVLADRENIYQKSTKLPDLKDLVGDDFYFVNKGKIRIQHSKAIIIDETITITGSFNFTRPANNDNSENLLVINKVEIAEKFIHRWNELTKNEKLSSTYKKYMENKEKKQKNKSSKNKNNENVTI